MSDQVSLDVSGQSPPTGCEGEKDAIAATIATISVRAMKQSVVDHDSITSTQIKGHLIGKVAERGMLQIKFPSSNAMCFWQNTMDWRAFQM